MRNINSIFNIYNSSFTGNQLIGPNGMGSSLFIKGSKSIYMNMNEKGDSDNVYFNISDGKSF